MAESISRLLQLFAAWWCCLNSWDIAMAKHAKRDLGLDKAHFFVENADGKMVAMEQSTIRVVMSVHSVFLAKENKHVVRMFFVCQYFYDLLCRWCHCILLHCIVFLCDILVLKVPKKPVGQNLMLAKGVFWLLHRNFCVWCMKFVSTLTCASHLFWSTAWWEKNMLLRC